MARYSGMFGDAFKRVERFQISKEILRRFSPIQILVPILLAMTLPDYFL